MSASLRSWQISLGKLMAARGRCGDDPARLADGSEQFFAREQLGQNLSHMQPTGRFNVPTGPSPKTSGQHQNRRRIRRFERSDGGSGATWVGKYAMTSWVLTTSGPWSFAETTRR